MQVTRKLNKDVFAQLTKLVDSSVGVGYFPDAMEPDGQPSAQVAYKNELGDKNSGVPMRSFMRTTFHEQQDALVRKCSALVRKGMPIEQVMNTIGAEFRGNIEAKIIKIASAGGNSPKTIARKGFDSPLVDTGAMLQNVSFQVGYAE